ncbi:hypothetical protein BYT27DRAFT_7203535 [Phlegmacium glaucopus]|nr:hypothetical protein BYT27DRAFT_7203535 [Phlegmacium glaucopus]
MLDAYDMQMIDYTNDLDIQMHPSSSDQWFQDESKMEEDGPQTPMKSENHSQTQKTDGHLLMREKADVTIEVDMESYVDETNVEYEMLDDEERKASGTELLDVDVYDASNAHSPSMLDADALDLENHNLATLDNEDISTLSTPYKDLPITSPHPHHETSEPHFFSSNGEGSSELQGESEPTGFDSHKNAELNLTAPNAGISDGNVQEPSLQDVLDDSGENPQTDDQPFGGDEVSPTGDALSESIDPTTAEASGQEDSPYLLIQPGGDSHNPLSETSEPAGDSMVPVNSSGDPHEISEGVYIDPPPPVLLSMAPAEEFHFSFFNEATEWTQNDSSSPSVVHVVLQQYPTLYYEPLSSVFEALHQDEFTQSISNLIGVELMLDAIDLKLTITEDNIYAREISLHDLNILHDALGFSGPLRMRLNFTTPRFIVRYHALQDQISRLHLEQPNLPQAGEEVPEKNEEHSAIGENPENEQDNENEPKTEQDHDNTIQEVVSEVLVTVVDGQFDQVLSQHSLPEPNEESDLQHSTDKDTTEESPVNPLISDDANNLHPTVHDHTTTTDVHSGSSEVESCSEDGKIISLDVVEAEWDHESRDVAEGEHSSEDSGHSPKVVSYTNEEQALKDMNVQLDVTEQDDAANTWKEADHEEVDHADATFAEGEELYTYKPESIFDEQEPIYDIPELDSEEIENGEDYGDLLELPTDPINFEGENWDDDQNGEGELDVNWDLENDTHISNSNHSSVTLSSKASKRSFNEVDSVGDEDGHTDGTLSPPSPGQKRSRIH